MLTRLSRDYKRNAYSGIGAVADMEQARDQHNDAIKRAERGERKSMMGTGAGMGLRGASQIASTLGVGAAGGTGAAAATSAGMAASAGGGMVPAAVAGTSAGSGLGTGAIAGSAVPIVGTAFGALAGLALSELF